MMKKFIVSVLFAAMVAGVNAETAVVKPTDVTSEQVEAVVALVNAGKAAGLNKKQTLELVAQQIEKNAFVDQKSMTPRTKKILIAIAGVALVGGVVLAYIYLDDINKWWNGTNNGTNIDNKNNNVVDDKKIVDEKKKNVVGEKELEFNNLKNYKELAAYYGVGLKQLKNDLKLNKNVVWNKGLLDSHKEEARKFYAKQK